LQAGLAAVIGRVRILPAVGKRTGKANGNETATATARDVIVTVTVMEIETVIEIASGIATEIVNRTMTRIASDLGVIGLSLSATVMRLVVIPDGPKEVTAMNPTRRGSVRLKESRERRTPRKIPTRWNAKLATESGC
jgi:hypothetical protein